MTQGTIPTVTLELTIPEAEEVASVLGAHIDLLNRLRSMKHTTEAESDLMARQRNAIETVWSRLLRLW